MIVCYHMEQNWGDVMSPWVAGRISGEGVTGASLFRVPTVRHYFVMGSIMKYVNRYSVVWGTGFIDSADKCSYPLKVCAVRGPLSARKLDDLGIECPPVYGDPALLMPRFIDYPRASKYELGLIPHYVDKNSSLVRRLAKMDGVKMIDIQGTDVIKSICQCKVIASSSLHGLILADAYNKPNVWINTTQPLCGDGFKFRDYFASCQRKWQTESPFVLEVDTTVKQIMRERSAPLYTPDVDLLLEACPFKR